MNDNQRDILRNEIYTLKKAIAKCERRIGAGKYIKESEKKMERLVPILQERELLYKTDCGE